MSYTAPPALIPAHEPQRLRTLYHYHILNTSPEPVFDHLTSLAAQLFGLPVALISLVDAEEVEFKANTGLPGLRRVARPDSLCSAAVLETEVLVFRDLNEERCALVNPLVAEDAGLRFYAGAALRMPEGDNIGTLCVIGREPRPVLTPEEARVLQQLARLTGLVIELRAGCLPPAGAPSWAAEQASLVEQLAELAAFARYLTSRGGSASSLSTDTAPMLTARLAELEAHLHQRIAQYGQVSQ